MSIPTEAQVRKQLDEATVKMLAAKQSPNGDRAYQQMKQYYEGAVNRFRAKGYTYEPPAELRVDPTVQLEDPQADIAQLRMLGRPVVDAPVQGTPIELTRIDTTDPEVWVRRKGQKVRMTIGGSYLITPRVESDLLVRHKVVPRTGTRDAAISVTLARSNRFQSGTGVAGVRVVAILPRPEGAAPDYDLRDQYGPLYINAESYQATPTLIPDWKWKDSQEGEGTTTWLLLPDNDMATETPMTGTPYLLYNYQWRVYLCRGADGRLALREEPDSTCWCRFEVDGDQSEHNAPAEADRIEQLRRKEMVTIKKYSDGKIGLGDAVVEMVANLLESAADYFFEFLGAVLEQLWRMLLWLADKVVEAIPGGALLLLGALGLGFVLLKSK